MSGVANIEKWKKEKNKVRKEKLGRTLLREYARRGCATKARDKLTRNNKTFCDAYDDRKKKSTRKVKKLTGNRAKQYAKEYKDCGIDADCAATVNVKYGVAVKVNNQTRGKATSSNKIKNKQPKSKAKSKELIADQQTAKCVLAKKSGYDKAVRDANKLKVPTEKAEAMIQVYAKNQYGCYTKEYLLDTEVINLINAMKTNKKNTVKLKEIYYKLKAIELVLQAKGVRTTPSNVKNAATSLGNQLNLTSIKSMSVNDLVQKGNKLIEESKKLKQSSMGNPGKHKKKLNENMVLMLKIDAELTKRKKKREGKKMRQQAALIENFLKNALKLKF